MHHGNFHPVAPSTRPGWRRTARDLLLAVAAVAAIALCVSLLALPVAHAQPLQALLPLAGSVHPLHCVTQLVEATGAAVTPQR